MRDIKQFNPSKWRHWFWIAMALVVVWIVWNATTDGQIRESIRDQVSVGLLVAFIVMVLATILAALLNRGKPTP